MWNFKSIFFPSHKCPHCCLMCKICFPVTAEVSIVSISQFLRMIQVIVSGRLSGCDSLCALAHLVIVVYPLPLMHYLDGYIFATQTNIHLYLTVNINRLSFTHVHTHVQTKNQCLHTIVVPPSVSSLYRRSVFISYLCCYIYKMCNKAKRDKGSLYFFGRYFLNS